VPARQRVLLVGGADVFAFPDAWEWDGTQWTGLAAPPVARAHHGLACEAQGQGVILFGGGDSLLGAPRFGDSYRWSGSTWQQIDSDPPPPRRQFAACTDLLRLRTVIQGGMSASGQILDDTFEWDGSRWHQLTSSPGRRFDHAMAYDLARGKTVLFGGSNLSAFSAETWELDGVAWTQASVPGPPARAEHAMAYHTPTLRTVLFGGRGLGPQLFGDTWTFDGIVWQQQQPAQSPSPRTWHAMATDAARASVVLFGGIGNGAQRNDTWKWDGVNWIQAAPPTSPPPRGQCAMAYDWQRQRVVLHGGSLVASNADYWEWDGTTWRSLANAAGQSLRSHHLSYDITSERMLVLFGSRQGDEPGVAVLTTAPAAVSTLGAGCGSTAGPPRFTADAPYLGNRGCALELAGLANAPCLFAAAFSTLSQPLGAGCTLLLAPPITDVLDVTNSSGIAQRVLPIALKPALRGLVVYAQGGVLDPSAPLGFGLTPGLRLAVGD
jgi:hypothetical protein